MPLASPAQEKLPDIGSSAGELLTPARQAEYGAMMLRELRNYGYLLEDPLVNDWLQTMGTRLGSNSDQPRQPYTFFVMKDRQINAFATLGGYIGVNAGLVLTAEREDEVAAVLSTKSPTSPSSTCCAVERAQRDQIPILLGHAGGGGGRPGQQQHVVRRDDGRDQLGHGPDAAAADQLHPLQRIEADRLGIRTLSRSGYDVDAMAGFFERMSAAMRGNEGATACPSSCAPSGQHHPHQRGQGPRRADEEGYGAADHQHPTGERKERWTRPISLGRPRCAAQPLLPGSAALPIGQLAVAPAAASTGRASACACSARIPPPSWNASSRPGQAAEGRSQRCAALWPGAGRHAQWPRGRRPGPADPGRPAADPPGNLWLALGLGEAESRAGQTAQANSRFRQPAAPAPQQPPGGTDLCRDPERTGQPRGAASARRRCCAPVVAKR
jgi:hypothetical protein